ncbi:MAG: hypothetical protein ACRDS9_09300 [Pseudonocardiaceae bacterium]
MRGKIMQHLTSQDLTNIRTGLEILDPSDEEAAESVARTSDKVNRIHHAHGYESAADTLRVLLADDEDALVVGVPGAHSGERLGAAAIFNTGRVSAWRIRDPEVTHHHDDALLIEVLRNGGDLGDFRDRRDHRDARSDHELGEERGHGGQ